MHQYLITMRDILHFRQEKVATRAESDSEMPTIGMANVHFQHDLSCGFPLITTRSIPWKQTFGELRSFLMGHDHVGQFQDNGCNFWDPWAREDGTLGPIYGVVWNRFSQLAHVVDCIRSRQTDRRMVVSAWRPDEHDDMVLPPCHLLWCVTIYDGRLNLSWIQRSADWPVGVPHNICSYALLAHLLAKWAGLKPGSLDAIFCDAHVYKNQIEQAEMQLVRQPRDLPQLHVRASATDFHDWEATVLNYNPHPPIKYEVTV